MVAEPLHELTRDDVPFTWTSACEEAFANIKNSLLQDVVLPFPDFEKPFIVDCDASEVGMGDVLSQRARGAERPLVMESRLFTTAARKWHIREKEAMPVGTQTR